MVEWLKADQHVLDMAQRLIDQYHSDLAVAQIGFTFRDPPPKSRGKVTAGKAIKVSEAVKAVMDDPVDFIIWLALDIWKGLSITGQQGLLDHQLQHCTYRNNLNPQIRHHDIEEFFIIVDRHGSYRNDIATMDQVIEKAKQNNLFDRDELVSKLIALGDPDITEVSIEYATALSADGVNFTPSTLKKKKEMAE